jgi:hypothetical protein
MARARVLDASSSLLSTSMVIGPVSTSPGAALLHPWPVGCVGRGGGEMGGSVSRERRNVGVETYHRKRRRDESMGIRIPERQYGH